MEIKLLDLCCKAGGAAMGYFQAATELGVEIEITGIDIEPQPNYPFKFVQADAVEYLQANYQEFTHIHASPPCQKYSVSTVQARKAGKIYKDNLTEIQIGIKATGLPGIIENVMQAPIPGDVVLSGHMFGLQVLKKRKFQLINFFMLNPIIPPKRGTVQNGDYAQVLGHGQLRVTDGKPFKIKGKNVNEVWSNAMGIDWMSNNELAEAIPPAYTKYIGKHFFKVTKNN
jgi:DNA (cytosine-5)-methyltransferase 1